MLKEPDILRDYSLVGVETPKAIAMGLAEAEWYQSPVPREKMPTIKWLLPSKTKVSKS